MTFDKKKHIFFDQATKINGLMCMRCTW